MAFTTWAAVRTDIKDKIAAYVGGDPCVGSYTVGSMSMSFKSIDELKKLFQLTYDLEEMETSVSPSARVTYGRHRRM